MIYDRTINRVQTTSSADPHSCGEIKLSTYKSHVEPQSQLIRLLRDAGLVVRAATSRLVAAFVDNVFARCVHFGCKLRHLDDFLVWPAAHSVLLRPQNILSDVVMDVCGNFIQMKVLWGILRLTLPAADHLSVKTVAHVFHRSQRLHFVIC